MNYRKSPKIYELLEMSIDFGRTLWDLFASMCLLENSEYWSGFVVAKNSLNNWFLSNPAKQKKGFLQVISFSIPWTNSGNYWLLACSSLPEVAMGKIHSASSWTEVCLFGPLLPYHEVLQSAKKWNTYGTISGEQCLMVIYSGLQWLWNMGSHDQFHLSVFHEISG